MRKVINILCILIIVIMLAGCGKNQEKQESKNNEPNLIELVSYAETALESITKSKVSVSVKEDDWNISKTGLRYVMSSELVEFDGVNKSVVLKLEFEDDKYEYYKVLQLKIDNKNIEL